MKSSAQVGSFHSSLFSPLLIFFFLIIYIPIKLSEIYFLFSLQNKEPYDFTFKKNWQERNFLYLPPTLKKTDIH